MPFEVGIPSKKCDALQSLVKPHVQSFNYFLTDGLNEIVRHIEPLVITHPVSKDVAVIRLEKLRVDRPETEDESAPSSMRKVYPYECREQKLTYRARLVAAISVQINVEDPVVFEKRLGYIPIMTFSKCCSLSGMTPRQLVTKGEDAHELGGTFVVQGIDRIIRMVIIGRRNYPMALIRSSFKKRGDSYTEFAVLSRCVRSDQTSVNLMMHLLTNGEARLSFWTTEQHFLPILLILKALKDVTDFELLARITQGDENNPSLVERARMSILLHRRKYQDANSQKECLSYLGSLFRRVLFVSDKMGNEDVGRLLIKRYIAVHLDDFVEKYEFLLVVLQKLYALADGMICEDTPDSPMNQEVLLPGHVYQIVIKNKLQAWLRASESAWKAALNDEKPFPFEAENFKILLTQRITEVGRAMERFISTGTLNSTQSALGLNQDSGFTLIADRINFMRYLSHFRSVHRGQIFTQMKTTSVRRLLSDAWGFFCPVHTPDGSPCGLLNHLSRSCEVTVSVKDMKQEISQALAEAGVLRETHVVHSRSTIPVLLDGRVIGRCLAQDAARVVDELRYMKVEKKVLPKFMEIAYLPPVEKQAFPGIFVFTSPARLVRPVHNLALGKTEYIGPLEQIYMDIGIDEKDIVAGRTTHIEISPTHILSVVASLTPFSDFNQSPRNMYQCQMAKQAMGTPYHSLDFHDDNKVYRLQCGHAPICRTKTFDEYKFDEYPNGVNCVVAVISYTGYDMEDAMIINKQAAERGLFQGTVYTTKVVDLGSKKRPGESVSFKFCNIDDVYGRSVPELDEDGLPEPGTLLHYHSPLYSYVDVLSDELKVVPYEGDEPARVESVKMIGYASGKVLQKVSIKLRYQRNPTIGDKFSSRHGQKGTLSILWRQEDMPFTESGMTPDVIINPHAFPSRMTIGMLYESSAAKAGALHGSMIDCTSFAYQDIDGDLVSHFGEMLSKSGYNFYGKETMYSGTDGCVLEADIYIGLVYYQRLRHMVKDKFQVRTTGPVNALTLQPVKGRKMGGGIRFGEMERDALLSHGTAFLLQDRLLHCSDEHNGYICKECGTLLGPSPMKLTFFNPRSSLGNEKFYCQKCRKGGDNVKKVKIPFVLRYFINELAALNINVTMGLEDKK